MTSEQFLLEHRIDRPYDDAGASHLVMPGGSLVASFDRGFLAAATREVLRRYGWAGAA